MSNMSDATDADAKRQPCERCSKNTNLEQLCTALEYCQVEEGHKLKGVYVCESCEEYLLPLPYDDMYPPVEGVFYIYNPPANVTNEQVSANE